MAVWKVQMILGELQEVMKVVQEVNEDVPDIIKQVIVCYRKSVVVTEEISVDLVFILECTMGH